MKSSKSEKDLLLFLRLFLAFFFSVCIREQRGKILKINVHFRFSGVVGSERKNIFDKRVDKPLYGVIVVKEKYSRQRAGSPFSFALLAEMPEKRDKSPLLFAL